MKIQLKNFRCYIDQTFDFGDNGLALLTGPSGQGKTTILMGIYFALFGTGTKVVSYGKSSCMVQLEFDNLKIVRTKRPNRLLVNDVHEDQAGQDIIDRIFGNTFDVTGYISQNALNSFVLMSPMDKLGFLEKFAFKDVDLGKLKGRCKAKITERNEALLRSISQLELATNVFNELSEPTPVEFPIKCSQKQQDKIMKNEEIRFKNCNTLINRTRRTIKETQKELTDTLVLQASTESKQETLSSVLEKLNKILSEEGELHFEGVKKLNQYRSRLLALQSRRELNLLRDRLDEDITKLEEMKESEYGEYLEKLRKITASVWQQYTKEELSDTITDCKQCLEDAERINTLKSQIKGCQVDTYSLELKKTELEQHRVELDKKRHTLDILKTQQELYSCPHCESKLRLKDEQLHLADDMSSVDDSVDMETLKSEINTLGRLIRKLELFIPNEENKLEKKQQFEKELEEISSQYEEPLNLQTLKDDFEYLREYGLSQNELEKKRKELEKAMLNEKYSSSYMSFKQNIAKQKVIIKELEKKSGSSDEELSEEELRIIITQQEQLKDKMHSLYISKTALQEEKEKYTKQLDEIKSNHLEKYKQIRSEEELRGIIDEQENIIKDLDRKREEYEQNLKKVEEYKKYKEEEEKYFTWQKKVINLQIQEKEDRDKYAAATMLKDKILEAESMAMLNIIISINTHAQLYLDCFFTENPIAVRLVTFKETKKCKKPQINMDIEYKGMECDLSMLSGGELSRVILAYTLALGEMFNTPLLLLDECTASLDQDLSTNVFNSVREHFTGKLVVIIAHQVITGTFDRTVTLCSEEE